jgi:hypothetical protein
MSPHPESSQHSTPVCSVLHERGTHCFDSQANKVGSPQSEAPHHSTTACGTVAVDCGTVAAACMLVSACVIVAIWKLTGVCEKIPPTREEPVTKWVKTKIMPCIDAPAPITA